MTIEEAAKSLDQKLRPAGWLVSVGFNPPLNDTISVYVKKPPQKILELRSIANWQGYAVKVINVGGIKPL